MYLEVNDFKKPWLFYRAPLGWCQKPAQDTLRMFDRNPRTDPKTTPYYKISVWMVSRKAWWHNAKTTADCVKRTQYLVSLRKSIERERIKTAITINIKNNGKMVVWDGYHRLFCADYIGYKRAIPVVLKVVGPNFKAIEKLMLKLGGGKRYTYHPLNNPSSALYHPYFRNWKAWRPDTPARFRAILAKIGGAKTVLDIGACYSNDTEVLTEDGWRLFKDITENDKIATLNLQQDTLEYQTPSKLIRYHYSGKMFHQGGKSIDLLVTPDHRMLVMKSTCSNENKPFEIIKASNLPRHVCYKRSCSSWSGQETPFLYLPAVVKYGKRGHLGKIRQFSMDPFLKFMGFWISEGYCRRHGKKSKAYEVIITQKTNEENRSLIHTILKELGIHYTETIKGKFVISNKQLYMYLSPLGKAKDKYIPKEFKCLSSRQLRIFLTHLLLGDGSEGRIYFTSSPKLAADVQEIVLKVGLASTVRVRHKNRAWLPNYAISITGGNHPSRNHLSPNPNAHIDKREWIDYDDLVHCVTVPNGIIYVKRNGKSCWCGNCEGYFSINLAVKGYDVTAIELNPQRAQILKFFASLRGVQIPVAVEDWRSYCARAGEFDAAIFLSTFHHQVIHSGLGEFQKLGLIRAKKLFFEMCNKEPKMAKFSLTNNDVVKRVLANTKFTRWEKIYTGQSPFLRDIYMFS